MVPIELPSCIVSVRLTESSWLTRHIAAVFNETEVTRYSFLTVPTTHTLNNSFLYRTVGNWNIYQSLSGRKTVSPYLNQQWWNTFGLLTLSGLIELLCSSLWSTHGVCEHCLNAGKLWLLAWCWSGSSQASLVVAVQDSSLCNLSWYIDWEGSCLTY